MTVDPLAELRARADAYRSSQLMVLLGDDFSWQKAEMMYAAWEKLAAAANAQTSGRKVRVFFSTPSRYFAALRAEKTRLPTYSGELMPYADNEVRRAPQRPPRFACAGVPRALCPS